MPYSLNGVYPDKFQILSEDGARVLCRAWRLGDDGARRAVLVVLPGAERPTRSSLNRLTHEHGLKDELDSAWAVRPLELLRDGDRAMLVLEFPTASRSTDFSGDQWKRRNSSASRSRSSWRSG